MVKVVGWYGHANIGDESYKLAFPELFPGVKFEFCESADADYTQGLVLGGGDILSPHFLSPLMFSPAKPKVIVSASATKNTPFDLLHQFDQIFVRDLASQKMIQDNGINCSYMPDIAFTLKPRPENGRNLLTQFFLEEGHDLYTRRVGIIFNSYLYGKEDMMARDFLNFHHVANILAHVADSTNVSFVFIPMCTGMPTDDRITNSIVANYCKYWKKNVVVYNRLCVQSTLDLISSLDVVISTRLHSSIFSLIAQVPFLDLTHHDKNRQFIEAADLNEYSLSYWDLEEKSLQDKLNSLLEKPEHRTVMSRVYNRQLALLRLGANNVRLF